MKKLLEILGELIFWMLWIPVCIILITMVLVTAYLNMVWQIVVSFFKRKNDR